MPVHSPSSQQLMPHQQNLCSKGHSIFKESCKACLSLKKDWYSYLNRSGFEDAEKGLYLVGQSSLNNLVAMQHKVTYDATLNYYQWAQECLTTCSFDSMIDRLIWQHHAEGYTQGEISPVVGLGARWVNRKIKRIESLLKSR